MVIIKTITRFNQIMLQGDIQAVFQLLEILDKRTIEPVCVSAYKKESSDGYEVSAVCNMAISN